MSADRRLAELQLQLPPPPRAMGLYKPIVVVDSIAYLSGHGPLNADGSLICGCLGLDLDVEAGQRAAQQTGLAILATLRDRFGSLDRVERLIKTLGLIRSTPDFTDQPAVLHGFSGLMRDVFGEDAGVGARSAVGAAALPAGMAVEVEAIFEVAS